MEEENEVLDQETQAVESPSRRSLLRTVLYVSPAILTLVATPSFATTGSSGCTDGGLDDWDTDGNDGDTDSDSDGTGDDSDTDFCT